MRDQIYQTLNECVAVLTVEVMTGQSNMYVTIDRGRYNALLKAIVEAKRLLVAPEDGTRDSGRPDRRQETRRLRDKSEKRLNAMTYPWDERGWEPSGE